MELIRLLFRTSWQRLTLSLLAGFVSGMSSAGLIALINLALQRSTVPFSILALAFLGLCGALFASATISQILLVRLAEQIILNLRLSLTRQILACPLRQLEDVGIPRLLAVLTQDIEIIANASFPVTGLLTFVTLLVGSFIYLSWLSLPLFGLTLVLLSMGIFSNQYLIYRARHALKRARDEQDHLFRHFRTATEGIKELKLHQQRRQVFLSEDLYATALQARQHRITAANFFAMGGSWGLTALFLMVGVVLAVAPSFLVSQAVLSGYALTLLFLLTPIRGVLNTLPELLRANVALGKINALGLSIQEPMPSEGMERERQSDGLQALKLQQVTHAYYSDREDTHFTLGPIDLTLYPGELVFIIGGNGSGKSTLAKLLVGLYTPEEGSIFWNGEPLSERDWEWYRQQFTVVFSDFYLFDRLLGLIDCDRSVETQTYLQELHLDQKVSIQDGRFSTTALSQGQRKRLALLTAYLEDRAIYVFDEWASDQDPAFKKIFYTQLLPALKNRGKAVVVISHDDHYFDRADRIVKLDYGQIEYDQHIHALRGA
jgi:putative pyoverdin transport system ATP-binding/permease protein